jgi:hypothetical protein
MSRTYLPLLVIPAVALLAGVASTSATHAEDAPAQPAAASAPAPRSAELSRLFRFHATVQALALRDAVDRASFDDALREELRSLVRDHLKRVDDEAGRGPAAEQLDDLLDRAAALARDFNDKRVADWLDAHPSAYQPVQEQIALAEAYARATAAEPDAVVRAARAAGVAQDGEAALKRFANDAHDRVAKANEADAKRVREAQEKAGVPPEPPPEAARDRAPGEDLRRDAPRPGTRGSNSAGPGERRAAPDAPASPPPTPEQQRVQLLDALTLVDAHERLTAAARDVRSEAEKLLPEPARRKALGEEMLRWYQSLSPQDDAPREGEGKGAPGAEQRKSDPRDRRPPPGDPGF